MYRKVVRTARKNRTCDDCGHSILRGERYLSHLASPNHDGQGNVGWSRLAECRGCAERYGRSLDPVEPVCTCPVPPTGADLDLHVDGCPRENRWQPVEAV